MAHIQLNISETIGTVDKHEPPIEKSMYEVMCETGLLGRDGVGSKSFMGMPIKIKNMIKVNAAGTLTVVGADWVFKYSNVV